MSKNDKFLPSLFSREQVGTSEPEKEQVIPQTTLYDTPVKIQPNLIKKHVVLFGFSPANKKAVIDLISKEQSGFRKEEGKNYLKIYSDDIIFLDSLLKLNYKEINGEIIGAYRKNFGVVEDEEIYYKKRGIFTIVYEYLFGK